MTFSNQRRNLDVFYPTINYNEIFLFLYCCKTIYIATTSYHYFSCKSSIH